MLTPKQNAEIKEHLDKAQNPVFFFDNDPDGLCSFLLFQRYIGRGKGVPIKSFPDLTGEYFRKVEELNGDYIFILDKPKISKGFFEKVSQANIPVVWIDHHDVSEESLGKIPDFVDYYNPVLGKTKSAEPVTALCYELTQKKDDLWLAVIGCISDHYVPEFYNEFRKRQEDLAVDSKDAFEIFYKSEIGKIARIFAFALKDRTTNVINMLRFLMRVKSPYDVLEEIPKNHTMHERFNFINKKYQKLLQKAEEIEKSSEKLLFFQYGGDLSISSDLANELSYKYPDKIIVVVYISGIKANVSVRGKNIRKLVLSAIEGIEGATGGGHKDAVGSQLSVEDLEKFRERLEELVKGKCD